MRRAKVLYKNEHAGTLSQLDDGSFEFAYLDVWVLNPAKPAVSLTLPKTMEPYRSSYLFPFFFNMLPEGSNKQTVCYHLRIDQDDDFGILMATSKTDTIGAVSVVKENEA
jgi:HipA-like protein